MGLDVSLYKVDSIEKMINKEKEYERKSEEIWDKTNKKYEELSDEEKESIRKECKALAKKMDLLEDGSYKNKKRIEKNSKKYPDHMFKIGYMRSSYNDGGINSVLDETIGMNLYDIFSPNSDTYYQKIDWKKSLNKANESLTLFSKHIEESPFRCMPTTKAFSISNPKANNEQEALNIVKEEFAKYKTSDSKWNYSNAKGEFYFEEPLQICAIIKGTYTSSITEKTQDCSYLIYKSNLEWYKQALEIVIEQIKYVLKQDNPDQYILGWSA